MDALTIHQTSGWWCISPERLSRDHVEVIAGAVEGAGKLVAPVFITRKVSGSFQVVNGEGIIDKPAVPALADTRCQGLQR